MSIPSINLNVRANTARAMADFKKFSDSLNNKFLVSGLKVDLISATLRQISNELSKSIGEQGLLGASSMRAAQNQAALLTSTFKGFGLEASKSINENMTRALSSVAVRAGGTMSDIRKTMSAVPFISTNLSSEERTNMAKQIMSFQRDLRRAGISDGFGSLANQFLSNNLTVGQMLQSTDPLAVTIGKRLQDKGAPIGEVANPEQRTRLFQSLLNDPELSKFLREQAKKTYGFKTYIEDLNTYLFNSEQGVFGSLRKVTMSARRTTTVFDETDKIINGIFGKQGIFIKFFSKVGQAFGVQDPLKVVIKGMDFIQGMILSISKFLDSDLFKDVVKTAHTAFNKIYSLFESILKSPAVANATRAVGGFFQVMVDLFKKIVDSPQFNQILTLSRNVFTGLIEIFGNIANFAARFSKSIDLDGVGKGVSKIIDIFNNLSKAVQGIFSQLSGGNLDSTQIVKQIKEAGAKFRSFVENVGKKLRGQDVDKGAEFSSDIAGTLIEEVGRGMSTLFWEVIKTLIAKAPEIAKSLLPALNKAFTGILEGFFGPFAGFARVAMNFMPGPLGQIARASTGVSAFGGLGGTASIIGAGALAFAPQLLGGLRGLNEGRRGIRTAASLIEQRGLREYLYRSMLREGNAKWRGYDRGNDDGFIGERQIDRRYGISSRFEGIRSGIEDRFRGGGGTGGGGLIDRITGRSRRIMLRGNPNAYDYTIGPLPDLGFGNGDPWSIDENGEFVPIRGALHDETDALRNFERSSEGRFERRYGRNISTRARLGRSISRMPRNIMRWAGRNKWALAGVGLAAGAAGLYSYFQSSHAAGLDEKDQIALSMLNDPNNAMSLEDIAKSSGVSASKLKKLQGQQQQQQAQSNALGNVLGGAAQGAQMGMVFGPWGALIGGVLGAGASLMDKGTRDAVGKFVKGLWDSFTRFLSSVGDWLIKIGTDIVNKFKEIGNGVMNAIKNGASMLANAFLDSITLVPRLVTGIAKFLISKIPDSVPIPGLKEIKGGVLAVDKILNTRIPVNFASGVNYSGNALDLEERLSGGRAFIANDREIVIPPGQLGPLTDLISRKAKVSQPDSQPPEQKIELVININNPVMLGNNKELIESLRKPVIDIINDAYRKNVGARSRPQFSV